MLVKSSKGENNMWMNEDDNKRAREEYLSYCNFIKTILMFSVVLYHSMALWLPTGWFNQAPATESKMLGYFADWLNSFHIYGFTLVSGFIFAYLRFEKNKYKRFIPFLVGKFKRLVIPYIVVSVIWVAPIHWFFYRCDIRELVRRYILGISPSQLWFLLMLFFVFMIVYFIGDYVYQKEIAGAIICVTLYGVGFVGTALLPNLFQFFTSCQCFCFFWIGMMMWKLDLSILKRIPTTVYLAVDVILFIGKVCLSEKENLIFKLLTVGVSFGLHIVGAVGAFIVLGRIAHRLNKTNPNYSSKRIYTFFETNSFSIYLFHQQVIYFAVDILNGKIPSIVIVVLSVVSAIIIAGMISSVFNRFKFTRFLIGG